MTRGNRNPQSPVPGSVGRNRGPGPGRMERESTTNINASMERSPTLQTPIEAPNTAPQTPNGNDATRPNTPGQESNATAPQIPLPEVRFIYLSLV